MNMRLCKVDTCVTKKRLNINVNINIRVVYSLLSGG